MPLKNLIDAIDNYENWLADAATEHLSVFPDISYDQAIDAVLESQQDDLDMYQTDIANAAIASYDEIKDILNDDS